MLIIILINNNNNKACFLTEYKIVIKNDVDIFIQNIMFLFYVLHVDVIF